MTLIFSDGMDSHGVTAKLADTYNTVTAGVTYLSSGGRFGGGAIEVNGTLVKFAKTFTPIVDLYVSFGLNIEFFNGGNSVIEYSHIGGATGVRADSTGNWELVVGAVGVASFPISAGVYHSVAMHFRVHGVSGKWTVNVDGIQVVDFSGDTLGVGSADTINGVSFSAGFGAGADPKYLWDDIIINDGIGSAPFNGLLIKRRIDTLRPNAAGDKTDFTLFPNTGEANWQDVDEVSPDDDATYVEDDVVNDEDLYNFEPMGFTPDTIDGLVVKTRAKNPDGGSKDLKHLIKSNLTTEAGASILGLTNEYQIHQTLIQNDPDIAAAWTKTAVDAVQGGYRVV